MILCVYKEYEKVDLKVTFSLMRLEPPTIEGQGIQKGNRAAGGGWNELTNLFTRTITGHGLHMLHNFVCGPY